MRESIKSKKTVGSWCNFGLYKLKETNICWQQLVSLHVQLDFLSINKQILKSERCKTPKDKCLAFLAYQGVPLVQCDNDPENKTFHRKSGSSFGGAFTYIQLSIYLSSSI